MYRRARESTARPNQDKPQGKSPKPEAKADPNDAWPLSNEGLLRLRDLNAKAAVELFTAAGKQHSKFDWAFINTGVTLWQLGCFEAAEEQFNKALEINRKNPWTFNGLGLIHALRENYPLADENYFEAIFLNSRFHHARLRLAELYLLQDELTRAGDQLRSVAILAPKDPALSFYRGVAAAKDGDTNAATEFWRKAHDTYGTSSAMDRIRRAILQVALGNERSGITALRKDLDFITQQDCPFFGLVVLSQTYAQVLQRLPYPPAGMSSVADELKKRAPKLPIGIPEKLNWPPPQSNGKADAKALGAT